MLQRAGTAASNLGARLALAGMALGACLASACALPFLSGAPQDAVPPAVTFPGGVIWQAALPAAPAHEPAYDDRRAYVALRDGTVVALDHASGAVLWTVTAAASVAPARAGEVLVAADGGSAWALDAETGLARWRRALPSKAARAPVATGAIVTFATDAGDAVALAAGDGREIWRRPLGATASSLAARLDRVYAGLEDGRVVALDAATGAVAWTRRLPSAALAITPLDDRVFVGAGDRFLYSLKTKKGGVAWRWRTGGTVTAVVAAGPKRIYFVSRDATLRALDRRHGDLRWQRPLHARAVGGPLLAGETVVTAGVSPELRGFRTEDGGSAGVVSIPGWAVDGPRLAPAAGTVPARAIVVTAGGQVLAIGQTVEPPVVPLESIPGKRLATAARAPVR